MKSAFIANLGNIEQEVELIENDILVVIPKPWWNQLVDYVNSNDPSGAPPPLPNMNYLFEESSLLSKGKVILNEMRVNVDFVLKKEFTAQVIESTLKLGRKFARRKVYRDQTGNLSVDLYPVKIPIFDAESKKLLFILNLPRFTLTSKLSLCVHSGYEEYSKIIQSIKETNENDDIISVVGGTDDQSDIVTSSRIWMRTIPKSNNNDNNNNNDDDDDDLWCLVIENSAVENEQETVGSWMNQSSNESLQILFEKKDPVKGWLRQVSDEDEATALPATTSNNTTSSSSSSSTLSPEVRKRSIFQGSGSHSSFSETSLPQVGQILDAHRTKDDKWYEARIIKIESRDDGMYVLVHFLSFLPSDDEWFHRFSTNLKPRNTKVPNWRSQLKLEEEVDINKRAVLVSKPRLRGIRFAKSSSPDKKEPEWVIGNVKKVDYANTGRVLCRIKTGTLWNQWQEEWIPLDSECIAPRYTHTQKPITNTVTSSIQGTPVVSGAVGLRNLGNTCFMNSMLQCLSHTLPLSEYFATSAYLSDINLKNALGMGGQLATAYAGIISEIWSDQYSVVVPIEFKKVLGTHASQFAGYAQQDSHELLSLLMDGLHEDLNRVVKKPVTEPVEGSGRSDDIVAKESWEVFQKRNSSYIVDTMMGLMRSHLTCPECKKETVKFDPYSNISLPIPTQQLLFINVIFLPLDRTRAHRYRIPMPKRANAKMLAEEISKRTKIQMSDLLLTLHHFNKMTTSYILYYDSFHVLDLSNIREDDVLAFELEPIDSMHSNHAEFRRTSFLLAMKNQGGARSRRKKMKRKKKSLAKIQMRQWEPVDRLYRSLAKPSEVIDAWLQIASPSKMHQEQLVRRLYSIVLDFEGNRYMPIAVAKAAIKAAQLAQCEIDPLLMSWSTGVEDEVLKGMISQNSLSFQYIDPADYNNSSLANQNEENGGGAHQLPQPQDSNSDTAQSPPEEPEQMQVPMLIPLQHRASDGQITPFSCFRCCEVIRVSKGSSSGEIHRLVWQHVKKLLIDSYEPPAKFLSIVNGTWSPPANSSNNDDDSSSDAENDSPPSRTLSSNNSKGEDTQGFPYVLRKGRMDSIFPYDEAQPLQFFEFESENPLVTEALILSWNKSVIASYMKPEFVASLIQEYDSVREKNRKLGFLEKFITYEPLSNNDEEESDKSIRLEQCFEKFRQREQLGEHDEWYCPTCKKHVQAYKKMDLWNTPQVLVVHLKRFLYETGVNAFNRSFGGGVQREKITDLVKFPLKGLDLRNFITGPGKDTECIYDLFAVSNHIGSIGGGHYTASILSPVDDHWYLMDDSRVTQIDDANLESTVVSNEAYVLFYQLRGKRTLGKLLSSSAAQPAR